MHWCSSKGGQCRFVINLLFLAPPCYNCYNLSSVSPQYLPVADVVTQWTPPLAFASVLANGSFCCSERLPGDGEADVDSIDDAFDGDDETFDRVEDEESTHSDGTSITLHRLIAGQCVTPPPL